jgi:hypothetical protein
MPAAEATVAAGLQIGYARCSTDEQDLTAQREALIALGVKPDRIYIDQGLTGTNRPSLSTSGETLTIEVSMNLEGENGERQDVGDVEEWRPGFG